MKLLIRAALKLVIPAKEEIAPLLRGRTSFKSDSRLRGNDRKNKSGLWAAMALIAIMSIIVWVPAFAQANIADTPIVYRSSAEEARFHALASSLRCVMCQNESLADSQAMIAHDLRREILAMMRDGKTDAQIRQFLVARYGEFVLYQPRVEPATWPLWFGPLGLLIAGGATVFVIVRRRTLRLRAQPTTAGGEPPAESSEDW